MNSLRYDIKTASLEQIQLHLMHCDGNFVPALSSRINLNEYCIKLFQMSVSFEAWHDDVLVGMVNAYFSQDCVGFITNVSTLPEYEGRGIASALLEMCLDHARHIGIGQMSLKVSQQNLKAIRLYSKLGFAVIENSRDYLLMENISLPHKVITYNDKP